MEFSQDKKELFRTALCFTIIAATMMVSSFLLAICGTGYLLLHASINPLNTCGLDIFFGVLIFSFQKMYNYWSMVSICIKSAQDQDELKIFRLHLFNKTSFNSSREDSLLKALQIVCDAYKEKEKNKEETQTSPAAV